MCGIIGIISKKDQVGVDIYNALLDQQHRGQDMAGILTSNNRVYLKKEKGLVQKIFEPKSLKKLRGKIGIGHVRYPTTHQKKDAQPFYMPFSGIALAHNGHIINEKQLREKLRKKRIYCDSDCDAETMLDVFSYFFMQGQGDAKEKAFHSLKKTMKALLGSYSVVSIIRGEGLFAFRDPHGIRPLSYGQKDSAYAFASETIALEQLGFSDIKDVEPGEAIFIDKNLNFTSRIINQKGRRHCMFEGVYFSRATSKMEGININDIRANLGTGLARIYKNTGLHKELKQKGLENKIIVAPVPETARPAAILFAEKTGYIYKDVLEKNRYAGRNFIKPTQTIREQETLKNIVPIKKVIQGKIVFLIDDSMVRGTTAKKIRDITQESGAIKTYFFFTCPPLRYPCDYGIDFHHSNELIAHNRTIREIEKEMMVPKNTIYYMDTKSLIKAIGMPKENLCLACLNKEYPTQKKHDKNTLKGIFGY